MTSGGVFVTFEGGEGCGKSTQLALLADALESAGLHVVRVREPGGTRVGEIVRTALLDPDHAELSPAAELLLYEASRAQLVAEFVRPALEAGSIVLCDRYCDSTTAYQGYGRGLPLRDVDSLNTFATGGLMPDLTVVLDIEPGAGLARATAAGADRLEGEDVAFHARVREGFLTIAEEQPERVIVVDGSGQVATVAGRIRAAVERVEVIARALEGRAYP